MHYTRKVSRVGRRSLAVVIPSDIANALKIKERQKLKIRQSGKKIIIEDWKR